MIWDLDDLASQGDIAALFGVSRATPANWATRYDDYPTPLKVLGNGPVFSRVAVVAWTRRQWPDGVPTRGRERGVAQVRRRVPAPDTT